MLLALAAQSTVATTFSSAVLTSEFSLCCGSSCSFKFMGDSADSRRVSTLDGTLITTTDGREHSFLLSVVTITHSTRTQPIIHGSPREPAN